MAAYCFRRTGNHRLRKMAEYRRRVLGTVQHYGGRYLAVGGKCEVVEGTWRPVLPVLIEFPNLNRPTLGTVPTNTKS